MRYRQLVNSLRPTVIPEMLIKLFDKRNDYSNNCLEFCLETSRAGFPSHRKRRKTLSKIFCDIDNEQILSFVSLPVASEIGAAFAGNVNGSGRWFIGTKPVVMS